MPKARSSSGPPAQIPCSHPAPSPRHLPPIVYEGIDETLQRGHLPVSWFNDQTQLHTSVSSNCSRESHRSNPTVSPESVPTFSFNGRGNKCLAHHDGLLEPPLHTAAMSRCKFQHADAGHTLTPSFCASSKDTQDALQADASSHIEEFRPPIRAKSLYVLNDVTHHEWCACDVLSFDYAERLYTIQWAFGNGAQKRVTSLQLILEGETEEDASRRHDEARSRRDMAEAKLMEELVVKELSRWDVSMLNVEGATTSGSSMDRILELAVPRGFAAGEDVIQSLRREAYQNYCQAQAKSVLLWHRPDLADCLAGHQNASASASSTSTVVLGKDKEFKSSVRIVGAPEDAVPSAPAAGSLEGKSSCMAERHLGVMSRPSGTSVISRVRLLSKVALIGHSRRLEDLLRVLNLCGEVLEGEHSAACFLTRLREPYTLQHMSRTLQDMSGKQSSTYRITWPEKITQIFLQTPGVPWCARTSGLVARRMEVCLHEVCLSKLRSLVNIFTHYADISEDADA